MQRLAALVLTLMASVSAAGHGSATASCPTVVDPAGDSAKYPLPVSLDPEAARQVDILSIGATSTAETITIEIRVTDLNATPLSPQKRYEAWGVMWPRTDNTRWYAAASRLADGSFRFSSGWSSSGPSHTVPTSGRVDLARSVIQIDVSRALIGSPAEGSVLSGIAGWADVWKEIGLPDTGLPDPVGGIGSITVASDDTATGDYVVGTDCRA